MKPPNLGLLAPFSLMTPNPSEISYSLSPKILLNPTYQTKREALLNEKIQLQEKIAQVERSATGWLEPCEAFLEAAGTLTDVVG